MKHIIQLWPGDWAKHIEKINEMVGMKNCITMGGVGKRIVCPFRRQEFWKCIDCFLSAATYGKELHKLWIEIPKYFVKNPPTKLHIDVFGNTNLYRVCCDIYCPFYIYAFH